MKYKYIPLALMMLLYQSIIYAFISSIDITSGKIFWVITIIPLWVLAGVCGKKDGERR
jgi:NADH:ubiquinone oxidoreductase subunit 4 (subunit M)